VIIAMIALASHALAGDQARAAAWAAVVRERGPELTTADFFRALPMKPPAARARIARALASHGIREG
jgi:hypothetical protein